MHSFRLARCRTAGLNADLENLKSLRPEKLVRRSSIFSAAISHPIFERDGAVKQVQWRNTARTQRPIYPMIQRLSSMSRKPVVTPMVFSDERARPPPRAPNTSK
jgi:hypothetical protein